MNETLSPEAPVSSPPADLSVDGLEHTVQQLLRRVDDLEAEIEKLRDTKRIEDRILDRVSTRISSLPPVAPPADFEERILQRVTAKLPQPKPEPAKPSIDPPSQPNVNTMIEVAKSTWVFVQIFHELKTSLWWLTDTRYHAGWWTRTLLVTLLVVALFCEWIVPLSSVPFIGWVIDKVFMLILGATMSFLVSRENDRYREWWKKR